MQDLIVKIVKKYDVLYNLGKYGLLSTNGGGDFMVLEKRLQ